MHVQLGRKADDKTCAVLAIQRNCSFWCSCLWPHVSGKLEMPLYHTSCKDRIYVPRHTTSTLRLAANTTEIWTEHLLTGAWNLKKCFPSLACTHVPFFSPLLFLYNVHMETPAPHRHKPFSSLGWGNWVAMRATESTILLTSYHHTITFLLTSHRGIKARRAHCSIEPVFLFPWHQLLNSSGHSKSWCLSWGSVIHRAHMSPRDPEGWWTTSQVQPLLPLPLISASAVITPVNIGKSIYFQLQMDEPCSVRSTEDPWKYFGGSKTSSNSENTFTCYELAPCFSNRTVF